MVAPFVGSAVWDSERQRPFLSMLRAQADRRVAEVGCAGIRRLGPGPRKRLGRTRLLDAPRLGCCPAAGQRAAGVQHGQGTASLHSEHSAGVSCPSFVVGELGSGGAALRRRMAGLCFARRINRRRGPPPPPPARRCPHLVASASPLYIHMPESRRAALRVVNASLWRRLLPALHRAPLSRSASVPVLQRHQSAAAGIFCRRLVLPWFGPLGGGNRTRRTPGLPRPPLVEGRPSLWPRRGEARTPARKGGPSPAPPRPGPGQGPQTGLDSSAWDSPRRRVQAVG